MHFSNKGFINSNGLYALRTPTRPYEVTCEAPMAAFAKSWLRGDELPLSLGFSRRASGFLLRKGLPHGVKPSLRLVDRISPFGHRFLAIRFRQRLAKAADCQPSIRPFRNVVRALNLYLASHRLKVINCRTTRRDARLFKRLQSARSNSLVVLGPSRHRRHLSQKDNPFIGHIELILANPIFCHHSPARGTEMQL